MAEPILLSETVLNDKAAVSELFSVRLAYGDSVWDASVSPQGYRIAWITQGEPRYQADGYTYYLWLSDLRGMNSALMGTAKGISEDRDGEERFYWPMDIRWTPDGQRISFRFGESIWTVQAD